MIIRNLLFITSLTVILFACSDPCEDIACVNGEEFKADRKTCVCLCETGYEGELCELELRAKYAGSYTGPEDCGSAGTFSNTYLVSTDGLTELNQIMINGLFVPQTSVVANLSPADWTTFTISSQTTVNYTIEGSGSFEVDMNGNIQSMSVDFTITSGTVSAECSSTRQKS